MFPKKINYYNIKVHSFFLSVLSLNYFIPIIIFGSITLFYLDTLDSEIVYNHILGELISKDFQDPINIFLGGSIKIEYMRRLLQPYVYLYSFLNTELAYWTIDALVKITSYFSFFILTKKINKNYFINCLIACLYASSNLPTHEGFGLAFFPYLLYLSIYKKNLKFKHFLLIFFFGINSDFIFTAFALPFLILIAFFSNDRKSKINYLYCFSLFFFSILLANINLLLIIFQEIVFHRAEFLRESLNLKETFKHFITNLFAIPEFNINSGFVSSIPFVMMTFPTIIIAFLLKDKNLKSVFSIIIILQIFLTLLKFYPIVQYINNSTNFIKTLNWFYASRALIFLIPFLILLIIKNIHNLNVKKKFLFFIFTIIILFQINSSLIPFYKEKILKIENYQNLYTFKGYYYFYDYKKIKNIVKNERTISIGLDPMVAVYHEIRVLDGYHNLYPLIYKKNFRKIIEPELEKNYDFKKYYDNWGSRVYTSMYFPKDINNFNLNYFEAKKLGANFIISKYLLISDDVEIIIDECKENKICLYKIK